MGSALHDLILADSPVAYWPLNETSGTTATDLSGNGKHGTYSNVTLGASGIDASSTDTCADFNGSSSYISVPSLSSIAFSSSWAIEIVSWADAEPSVARRILEFNAQTPLFLIAARAAGTSTAAVQSRTDVGDQRLAVAATVAQRRHWAQVGRRLAGGTALLEWYLDGQLFMAMAMAGSAYAQISGSHLFNRIGCARDNTEFFDGRLQRCAIYNTAPSAVAWAKRAAAARGDLKNKAVNGTVLAGDPPTAQKRTVVYVSRSGAEVVGLAQSDPGTGAYSSTVPIGRTAIYGLAFVDYGDCWKPSTAYVLFSRTITSANNGHWYEVETAGTSGTTEPTWPTNGSTVTDGSVTWRDKGLMERPWAEGPYVPPSA